MAHRVYYLLPDSILSFLLVPVLKDKAGNVSCMDNYRSIALASILSKVVENILLDRVTGYLSFCDNQFGFKPNHGADMCIYALKENVNLYRAKFKIHLSLCALLMPPKHLIELTTGHNS